MSDPTIPYGWTEQRVAMLRKGVADGLSDAQIARLIGGVTRNAVLGKRNRLGLVNSPTAVKAKQSGANSRKSKTPRPAQVTAAAHLSVAAEPKRDLRAYGQISFIKANGGAPLPEEKPDTIAALPRPWETRQRGECAFPVKTIGDVTHSCCAPSLEPGPARQYCSEHLKKIFTGTAAKPPRAAPEFNVVSTARARRAS